MPRLVAVLGGMSRQPGRGGGCRLRDRTLFFEIEMPCIIFISPIKQLLLRGRVLCLCLRLGVGHGEKFFYDWQCYKMGFRPLNGKEIWFWGDLGSFWGAVICPRYF